MLGAGDQGKGEERESRVAFKKIQKKRATNPVRISPGAAWSREGLGKGIRKVL